VAQLYPPGLRWRYCNPPPRGIYSILLLLSGSFLIGKFAECLAPLLLIREVSILNFRWHSDYLDWSFHTLHQCLLANSGINTLN
jgi:hypothetical protein